jgi:hypothetical protein
MTESNVPETLLRYVANDLRPIRPLAPPSRRALALVPLGVALLVGAPAFWGLRQNLSDLGVALAWGVSGLQSLAGLIVVGFALRESVPGRELPRGRLAALLTGGASLMFGITLWTSAVVPTAVPPGADWRYFWECFGMAVGPGVVAVTVAAWMASRALPARPAVAGSLYGLGAGLMSDAGARLFCWVTSPAHVLLAHGGVIACLMLLGAGVATVVERRRPLLRHGRGNYSISFGR